MKDRDPVGPSEDKRKKKKGWFGWATDAAGVFAEEASGVAIGRRIWGKIEDKIKQELVDRNEQLEALVAQLVEINKVSSESIERAHKIIDEKNCEIAELKARIQNLEHQSDTAI
ncbi:MAG: hypothetical protein Pars93KO_27150 [Parasphingorhabdus sp.]